MEEKLAAGAAARAEGQESEPEEATRVRVTDRRRVQMDDAEGGARAEAASDAPNLRPSYVEELEARTRAAEQKLHDVQSRFEQVRAELRRETDETRQRLMRSAQERADREKASFVAALLPVIDNLRRAVEAAEGGGSKESLLDGLRGTIGGFENALAASGVEAIDAVGQQFDPEQHEAVDTTEVEPEREGQVTAQYSRGYRMGGQLLRPARVQVGRARADATQAATE
ncbi:MAG TPA: nucleotide exchange factor GrpE [Pyrinomonadaceae bacterium]|nr:nucleotide exchange factor GrpE [Pyrinomonadaceae bacterium]